MTGVGGVFQLPGTPVKLSETPRSIRKPPSGFGEHTDAVLMALGFGADTIARLCREQVI
jgi:crotonobetainyl-CoA:carnitine CoA-transferase CaiB-like acyl-CoA transferase